MTHGECRDGDLKHRIKKAMTVLIATSSFGEYDRKPLELLKLKGIEVKVNSLGRTLSSQEVLELGDGCIGIVAGTERYNRDVLSKLRKLKVISRCGAGLDTVDLEAAKEMGIIVDSTPYGPTQAVAELTLGLILNLIRHVGISNSLIKNGIWKKRMGFLLGEMRVGILGLGRIGRRLAEMLKGFDAEVIGCDIQPDLKWAAEKNVTLCSRENVLKSSDIVCLHLPYEKELHHLIGAEELAMMKKGSYLVNASRGGLVDEKALYQELKSGHLAGAALDTFEREPYDGPLRELDNVILTPHIGSYGRAGRVKMERESVENLIHSLERINALG